MGQYSLPADSAIERYWKECPVKLNDFAHPRIHVTRIDADGKTQYFQINARKAGADPDHPSFQLRAGDIIYVGRVFFQVSVLDTMINWGLTSRWRRTRYLMKTFIASLTCLLIGLAIGYYVGHRHDQGGSTDVGVQQLVEAGESSDALLVATSARAISFIDAGQTQRAIETLSRPIAHFYTVYTSSTSGNERRLALRAMIEELARTNITVAAQIAEEKIDR